MNDKDYNPWDQEPTRDVYEDKFTEVLLDHLENQMEKRNWIENVNGQHVLWCHDQPQFADEDLSVVMAYCEEHGININTK